MRSALVFCLAFAGMEGISYATHRWVMHGIGFGWHRSHHLPRTGRFERNDRFPLCFSVVGVALFLLASRGPAWLWWIAAGVTAYGAAYLFVHEVYIHRRVAAGVPSVRYLEWLRASHRGHHRTGGEPYGMLLPLVRRRPAAADRFATEPLDRRASA